MSFEQIIALVSLGMTIVTASLMVGLWRGRQEAADVAAEKAISHTETVFGLRLKNLESQVANQADKIDMRIRVVDTDINGLKQAIADIKLRFSDAESERREEFQRLHKIGNETHALIVQHLTKLQEVYIPRAEYEARSDDVERRVSRLEQKS